MPARLVTVSVALALAVALTPGLVTPTRAGAAAAPTRLGVYLVRGEKVAPVRRVVPRTLGTARAALTALLAGPTASERRAGTLTTIPAGTRLRGVTILNGVATVDLSRRFEAGGGSLSMLLRVAQVVYTATQFPTVHAVSFRLDGRPVEAIGGEGVVVAPHVGRASFEGQAPPILVEQPLPGDTVGSPLVVRGSANVFEARLVVELRTRDGRLLVRKAISATAGSGVRGTFATTLPLRSGQSRLQVVAYARSAKNGAPVHVVRVPVVRAP